MDRISSLPDELLCHILSFLTTKEAALTSVLAKRWHNLVAFVPCLDIDDSVFLYPEEGKRDRVEIIQSFVAFVDRIFELQGNSPIKKFSFKCLTEVDPVHVDGWIDNALARGVSDVDLLISLENENDDSYQLSPNGFKCSTLVKLKVDCGVDIGWLAGSIYLPMLKTLILDTVRVEPDKFEILLQALPVLEELTLLDMIWVDLVDVTVSSASLKTLRIKLVDRLRSLSLDTPSLVYFEHSGYLASDYPVVNMKNLLDAPIMFELTYVDLKQAREPANNNNNLLEDDIALGCSNVWKLFHGIRNVPNLQLAPDTIEVLSLCSESIPVFNHLKSLAFRSNKDRGWQAMPVLLRNCPNLETLLIAGLLHDVTDKCGDACDCISREEKGRSLTSCPVKGLEIQGFRGTMKEMHMIKHFLDYFPCLKEMDVFLSEEGFTLLRENCELAKLILEMFEDYNELSSCNIRFLVSHHVAAKWQRNQIVS